MQQRAASGGGEEGIAKTLVSIVQRDGVAGLWVGALPVLLFAFPESALQLSTHDWAVAVLRGSESSSEANLPVLLQILAGVGSALPSVLATNPLDMLAIRAADKIYAGSDMMSNIDALGTEGLYGGCAATWLRDMYVRTHLHANMPAHTPACDHHALGMQPCAAARQLVAHHFNCTVFDYIDPYPPNPESLPPTLITHPLL